MRLIGIDIGFGFTKAFDGERTVICKSIYGDAAEMQFWANFGENGPSEYFHVTIDGKSYFIGNLAERQSHIRHFTLNQEVLITDFIKVLSLSVLGLYNQQPAPVQVPVNIVAGLPVSYLKKYQSQVAQLLIGHHELVYHDPGGGQRISTPQVNEVQVIPQPLGSLFHYAMDLQGRLEENRLATQKIGVIDIGFKTTDFAVLDRMHYVARASRTVDTGMSKACAVMADHLRHRFGVAVELFRLYDVMRTGTFRMRGHAYNVTGIRNRVYQDFAAYLKDHMERLWATDWDIDFILLSGGGAAELAPLLMPLLPKNVLPLVKESDTRLNNVKGYFKYACRQWHKQPGRDPSDNQVN